MQSKVTLNKKNLVSLDILCVLAQANLLQLMKPLSVASDVLETTHVLPICDVVGDSIQRVE